MATATETREALATSLREVVPTKWTVYAWPNRPESLPCVVIEPRAPYQERRQTFRDRALYLRLTVLHQVAVGELGGDVIDGVLDLLLAKLDSLTDQGIAWERVASVGDATERAGLDAVGAAIDLFPISIPN